MKKGIYLLIMLCFIVFKSYCQIDSISIENYKIIKQSLISYYDSSWYENFSKNNGWFYINFRIDSTGRITKIQDCKVGVGITSRELRKFGRYMKNNIYLKPYSPDPSFTKEQYFIINNNYINLPFKFSSRIFSKPIFK